MYVHVHVHVHAHTLDNCLPCGNVECISYGNHLLPVLVDIECLYRQEEQLLYEVEVKCVAVIKVCGELERGEDRKLRRVRVWKGGVRGREDRMCE